MPVYITVDKAWVQTLESLKTLDLRDRGRLLLNLAALQRSNIDTRVRKGLGVSDTPYPPAKKMQTYGGTTLVGGSVSGRIKSAGNMIGAMQAMKVSDEESRIIFSSPAENAKALWAVDGTRPHKISARNKKALAFAGWIGPGAFNNAWTQGTKNPTRGYVGKSSPSGRKKVVGYTILQSVNHPGTPPRPFFGISPNDEKILLDYAGKVVSEAMEKVGA